MESVINPVDNPELSLKKKYNKRLLINLDIELYEEMKDLVDNKKDYFNSVSHYIRCAIIEKLKPNDKYELAFSEGYNQARYDMKKRIFEEEE